MLSLIFYFSSILTEQILSNPSLYQNEDVQVENFVPQEGIKKTNARMAEIKKAEEKRAKIEKAKGFINMGDFYFEKGEYEKALSYYQTAMQIAPEDAQIKQKILKTLDIMGKDLIKTFEGHTDSVLSVVFSPDGKLALSGSSDNTLKLWDINTGKLLKTFEGHIFWVKSVAFAPDGKFALSGSWDNTLKLWYISERYLK